MEQALHAVSSNTYTVGSMFSGIGGVCMAFKQAGFDVAWANDNDKQACRTYRANFPHTTLIEEDVRNIDFRTLSPVDVIASGFPCTAFSVAGNQKGFDDPRGKLFFFTVEAIRALRPRAYILENVKNLLSHHGGRTFHEIRRTIRWSTGYSCYPFVLDSCRHGNIPQHRERVFIIGFRGEVVKDPLTTLFTPPASIPLTTSIRDMLEPGRQADKYYLPVGHRIAVEFEKIQKSENTVYQWRRSYIRQSRSGMCPTLTANMGGGGYNVPLICDDFGVRRLTPRECLRLQGFPESFVLPAGMADMHLYKQAGNSVTVSVVKRVAQELMRVLNHAIISGQDKLL